MLTFVWLATQVGKPPADLPNWVAPAFEWSVFIFFFQYYIPLAGFKSGDGIFSYMFSPNRGGKAAAFLLAHAVATYAAMYFALTPS